MSEIEFLMKIAIFFPLTDLWNLNAIINWLNALFSLAYKIFKESFQKLQLF